MSNQTLIRIVIIIVLLSVLSSPSFSQIRVGISLSTYISLIHFDDNLINRNLRITPTVLHSLSLVAQEPITRRFSIRAGFGYTRMGYRTVEIPNDYVGNRRYEQVGIGIQKTSLYRIPISLVYTLPTRDNNWYAQVGSPVVISLTDPNIPVTFGSSGISGTQTGRNNFSATLLVGVGLEKKLGEAHAVNIGLVYNHGFVTLVNWEIQYEADDKNYINTISSRNSYFGLNITYLFMPQRRK